jgi:protein-tyrosine-phosphatase
MNKKNKIMSAEEFLQANGIDLHTTVFSTLIDGFMRQPDLITLMDTYAAQKINELDIKLGVTYC